MSKQHLNIFLQRTLRDMQLAQAGFDSGLYSGGFEYIFFRQHAERLQYIDQLHARIAVANV